MTTSSRIGPQAKFWTYCGAAAVPAAGLMLCLLLVIAVIAFIARQESAHLQNNRADVILVDLQERLESDTALGFSLAEIEAAQPLLEKAILLDASIRAIEVMDERGVSLFNTDRGAIGEYAPASWLLRLRESQSGGKSSGWSIDTDEERTLALPVRGSFGELQGYVAMSFAASWQVDWTRFFLYSTLIALSTTALLIILTAWMAKARVERSLSRFEDEGSDENAMVMIRQARQRLDDALASLNRITSEEKR
ncbi:hypothetical protein RY831_16230 [Noviherbaspirillum sp. CPCC 100848]|uniref:Uncharacterized protein n=1 Tax=Noviherbaspirillum album TaxID=3080276 RepID=A0ABU6JAM9_9BURK|nr:hypothetical protein [Noviherbaspirillum sp. CPCC 100848]MEC4720712.1 hypothetical protein [Noviherbaspirillum sp. CPCC 100848]